jgi:outer membrane biosynthesis protein TonB
MNALGTRRCAAVLLALTIVVLAGSGCRRKTVQAAPPPPVAAEKNPPPEMKPPEVTGTPEAKPPTLVVPAPKAPAPRQRQRNTTPQPEPEPAATETVSPKPEAPRISPRYSPAEEAAYRRRTSAAITAAEKNLLRVYGRSLNATQNDMVEKVRGFLAQSREAVQAGDWYRAQTLAGKAEVLSDELVKSL